MERNPFMLPSDEEVFKLRDAERRERTAAREAQGRLKIWDKSTSTAHFSKSAKVSELLDGMGGDVDAGGRGKAPRGTLGGIASKSMGSRTGGSEPQKQRKQEKENMAEFVAKKREMFLVQMSLDTKREEIRKLEEKASMREDALKKSEQMLEEDAIRFDTFLKENDKKAHDAIKQAERETKLKQDKVSEIKRLNQSIQSIQSDISKHKEALDDCLRFKEFLDALSPLDFFDDQREIKRSRQVARREDRIKQRLEDWEALKAQKMADFELVKESEFENLVAKGTSRKRAQQTVEKMKSPKTPDRPDVAGEPMTSSGEDFDMYFTQPRQLVDVFKQLEAQNLFLIQNSQETEQTLEELRAELASTRSAMGLKKEQLTRTRHELARTISGEEAKHRQLTLHDPNAAALAAAAEEARKNKGPGKKPPPPPPLGKDAILKDLHKKVLDVYQKCGFDVSGGSPDTLFMLSELEAKLEDLLAAMAGKICTTHYLSPGTATRRLSSRTCSPPWPEKSAGGGGGFESHFPINPFISTNQFINQSVDPSLSY